MTVRCFAAVLLACIVAAGCDSSSPTKPGPGVPSIQISVIPNPIKAAVKGTSGEVLQCELTVQVTFRETAGGAGRIRQVDITTSSTGPGGTHQAGLRMHVDIPFEAGGSFSTTYTQQFDTGADGSKITFRISAEGVDAQERDFHTGDFEFPVVLQ